MAKEFTGRRGRPKKAKYRPAKELVYATVHKVREKGRLKKIEYRTVYGTDEQVALALKESKCSWKVNSSLCFEYTTALPRENLWMFWSLQTRKTARRCTGISAKLGLTRC
jgi:hypothetical protein